MKKIAFHNLGCKVNTYELDAMMQMLIDEGYQQVPFEETADIYIINTCTVTNIADRKSRQMIHKARKNNPDAVIVAVGCYVQTRAGGEGLEDIDLCIGNNHKGEIAKILKEYLGQKMTIVSDLSKPCDYDNMSVNKTSEHTRAFIKVQDGCNQFCSYCIIPFARGRIRSRSIEDVVTEVTGLAKAGYKEVVITGIHLSSFGTGTEFGLADLLEAVQTIEGIERIRMGSLEPQIVTEDFAKRVSALSKMCPHFHLSLQSGCDSVLVRMNRKYSIEEYTKGVEILRKYFDNPAITTDIIVGFPQETEEEYETTLNYVDEIQFAELHVFAYSKRAGTKAAKMSGQITNAVKKERSAKLIQKGLDNTKAYRMSHIGKVMDVLFEEKQVIEGSEYFVGFSKEYIKCMIKAEGKDLSNTILKVKATEITPDYEHLLVEIC